MTTKKKKGPARAGLDREALAKWLYDEFDPDYDMEPDACDAEFGPHWPWEEKADAERAYWLRKADEVLAMVRDNHVHELTSVVEDDKGVKFRACSSCEYVSSVRLD